MAPLRLPRRADPLADPLGVGEWVDDEWDAEAPAGCTAEPDETWWLTGGPPVPETAPVAGRRSAGGRRWVLAAAAVLVLAGTGCLGVAGYQAYRHHPPPAALSAGDVYFGRLDGPHPEPVTTASRVLGPSRPVRVRIARIGVRADVVTLRMGRDGVLAGPRTGKVAGWWRGSPTPGQRGAAVIDGHVDWTDGPAVFYRLGELRPGDEVQVTRADHRVVTFTVHAIRQYLKDSFPSDVVYGPTGGAQLRLVTCGGPFSNGHYQDNVVVFAHLTGVHHT